MMAAAVLALYAVVAVVALPYLLGRGEWADRAPRLAISVWLAACASAVASAIFSASAAAIPAGVIGHGLAEFFEACADMLSDGASLTSPGARVALLGAGLIAARITYCGAAILVRARRERRRHAEMLNILGHHDGVLDAVVLDHDEAAAYCLPGRDGKAVITTAALRSLAPEQVAAVLAHEQAHLRGRHHLALAAAEAFCRAFPRLPLFARARSEIARLIELLADDIAARRHPRIHIAAALVRIATGRTPAFALGAGGETALTRVRRMLSPAAPLRLRERVAGLAAVAFLLVGPATVAVIPGARSFLAHHCHGISLF
ncbi:M56 family metallopeptidase [Streptosporangium sp. NBC_01755]|uniref:M56 family metallopeptidase n=1 Tax=unclassified Streptosporangium TaxID=2632669 RepID=UPI002DDB5D4E|nr:MULTISPECIES: M56 family metallopeptidase [unclassified Streptosporangium]WSA25259.1 M56 family metallopeptidase [Streptosporangium sp. NBC_01810]WSD03424.1 M56 family metallopeptidase [Streptosporangium sp. NBC_01755]